MDRFKEFFAQSHTRVIVIVGILVIALAVPVTMRLVGQQQDLRQRASEIQNGKPGGEACSNDSECLSGECEEKPGGGPDTCTAPKTKSTCDKTPWTPTGQTKTTCAKPAVIGGEPICTVCQIETRTCDGKTETRTGTNCQKVTPTLTPTSTPTNAPTAVVTSTPNNPPGNGGGGAKPPVGGVNPSPTPATGPGTISGYVFLDNDYDRVRDTVPSGAIPADQGIGGVTVTLQQQGVGDPKLITKTTTTNSSGKYEFKDLPVGRQYLVKQTPPSCYETGVTGKNVSLTEANKTATADLPLNRSASCGNNGGGNPNPTGVTRTPTGGGGNNPLPTGGGGGGGNACGKSCSSNAQCAGAGGCSVCVRGRAGLMRCESAPSPTPTPPVTLTPTPTSTPVPTPTVTIGPNDIGANIQVTMPGIGTMVGDNNNPRNPSRSGNVQLYNTANQIVATKSATFTVSNPTASSSAFIYKGLVNFGSTIPAGFYYVATDFNNTLITQIPGVLDMKKGPTGVATAPVTPLIPGDLDRNNILDIRDYNLFIACYGTKQCAQKALADFNDNGTVESVDYNILLRSFAIRQGD